LSAGDQGQRYGIRRALKEFLFGMFMYELYQETLHLKAKYRDVFLTLLLGEFLGLPFMGNYYTLRLVPYVVEDIMNVKRRLLREHDIPELLHEGPAAH
jgi:hypothetical protein